MDGLRTILLLVGAAVVAGVWWWGSRRMSSHPSEAAARRAEPTFGDDEPGDSETTTPRAALPRGAAAASDPGEAAAPAPGVKPPPAPAPEARIERGEPGPDFDPERDMILTLLVVPAEGERFLGAEVVETLDGAGLRFGARQVFHRLADDGRSMYCVANMVEPGTLEPLAVRFEHIPGLMFFAVLPGPRSGSDTFADMIATARRIAQRLRGELADADRSSLTPQTIQHQRERVVEFERRAARTDG